MEYGDDFWKWVADHLGDDTAKLRLGVSKRTEPWIGAAILQVECRQKAAKKLPELTSSDRFLFPTALSAEQSTSERLARFHSSMIAPGDSVADLTAGLGVDAMALAKVASSVTAVEIDPLVASALRYNSAMLGLDNVDVINEDCSAYLSSMVGRHDVAFIDPARRGESGQRLFALGACSPDVVSMLPMLNEHFDRLIVKASPMLDVTATLRELPCTERIVALGTRSECKELVSVVDFRDGDSAEAVIEAVTLINDGEDSRFCFTRDEEMIATASYGIPSVGDCLFIPYPSTIKAAPFKLLAQRFDLKKISGNTHLYFANSRREGFPGEVFEVVEALPFASGVIKRFASRYPRINVAVRNFGMTADALRSKLKVKDGSDLRVIGVTAADGHRLLLVAR